jgi:hypothetical protein
MSLRARFGKPRPAFTEPEEEPVIDRLHRIMREKAATNFYLGLTEGTVMTFGALLNTEEFRDTYGAEGAEPYTGPIPDELREWCEEKLALAEQERRITKAGTPPLDR